MTDLHQVLKFLDSIEGAGYGGMAEFEIARATIQDALRPEIKDRAALAFNEYREGKWGAYDPYPIEAFTHFVAGFKAARRL